MLFAIGPMAYALWGILAVTVLLLVARFVVGAFRSRNPVPIPEYAVPLIDNALRRLFQRPATAPLRQGLRLGQRVLEIGPGTGTYTLAAARVVGDSGRVVTVDLSTGISRRLRRRTQDEGVANVQVVVGNAEALPFVDGSFGAAYLMAVIGELPDRDAAYGELRRVLAAEGTLAFSELIADPEYPFARRLIYQTEAAGFSLVRKTGSFVFYTLLFQKSA